MAEGISNQVPGTPEWEADATPSQEPGRYGNKEERREKSKYGKRVERLVDEIQVMLSYATSAGKEIRDGLSNSIDDLLSRPDVDPWADERPHRSPLDSLNLALQVHKQLSAIVRPATPESIRASEPKFMGLPGNNPVFIFLAVAAILSFVLLLVGAVTKYTGLRDELTVLASAGLGASFYGLYTAARYIQRRTFQPVYNQTYITRFFLGLIAGYILAQLPVGGSTDGVGLEQQGLALVGGFSAEAVAQILRRFADTLVAAVRGSGEDQVESRVAVARTRMARDLNEVLAGDDPARMRERLRELIDRLTQE